MVLKKNYLTNLFTIFVLIVSILSAFFIQVVAADTINPFDDDVLGISADVINGPRISGGTIIDCKDGSWILYKNVDFGSGITGIQINAAVANEFAGGMIRFIADKKEGGLIIAEHTMKSTKEWSNLTYQDGVIKNDITGIHDLYVVFLNKPAVANYKSFIFFGKQSNSEKLNLEPFSDVSKDDFFYEDLLLLKQLNIIKADNGVYKPNEFVKREEVAEAICKIAAIEPLNEQVFSDVPLENPKCGYISALQKLGYVSGYEDNTFKPDEYIDYLQLITVILRTTNHSVVIEQSGHWPSNYMSYAANKELLKGISDANSNVTRASFAVLLRKAAEMDLMQQSAFGTENKYTVEKDKNLFSEKKHITKGFGVVNKIGEISLVPNDNGLSEQVAVIGSNQLNLMGLNIDELIGYAVDYYYNEESGDKQLLAIVPKSKKNAVKTIDVKDLRSFNDYKIIYEENDTKNEKEINLFKTTVFMYNGEPFSDFTYKYNWDDFSPDKQLKKGEVKLLDNNGDGEYDICFVTNIKNTIASYGDKKNLQIVASKPFKDTNELLKFNDNTKYELFKNGKAANFKNIVNGDALSVAVSKSGKIAKVYASDMKIDGVITEVSEDEFTIGGKKYKIAPDFIQLSKESNTDNIIIPGPGFDGKFYIDTFNEIVWVEQNRNISGIWEYGLLTDYGLKNGLSSKAELKILCSDSNYVIYDVAESTKLDGSLYKNDYQALINDLTSKNKASILYSFYQSNNAMTNRKLAPQLIKFMINDKTQIINIDTESYDALKETTESLKRNFDGFSTTMLYTTGGAFKASGGKTSYSGKYYMGDQTLIFELPKYNSDLNLENLYIVRSKNSITKDGEKKYKLVGFDSNSLGELKVLILKHDGDNDEREILYGGAVVNKIVDTINKDGEQTKKIEILSNGLTAELLFANQDKANEVLLHRGDVIRISRDNLGQMAKIWPIYNYDGSLLQGGTLPIKTPRIYNNVAASDVPRVEYLNPGDWEYAVIGYIKSIDDKYMNVQYGGENDWVTVSKPDKVVVIDKNNTLDPSDDRIYIESPRILLASESYKLGSYVLVTSDASITNNVVVFLNCPWINQTN